MSRTKQKLFIGLALVLLLVSSILFSQLSTVKIANAEFSTVKTADTEAASQLQASDFVAHSQDGKENKSFISKENLTELKSGLEKRKMSKSEIYKEVYLELGYSNEEIEKIGQQEINLLMESSSEITVNQQYLSVDKNGNQVILSKEECLKAADAVNAERELQTQQLVLQTHNDQFFSQENADSTIVAAAVAGGNHGFQEDTIDYMKITTRSDYLIPSEQNNEQGWFNFSASFVWLTSPIQAFTDGFSLYANCCAWSANYYDIYSKESYDMGHMSISGENQVFSSEHFENEKYNIDRVVNPSGVYYTYALPKNSSYYDPYIGLLISHTVNDLTYYIRAKARVNNIAEPGFNLFSRYEHLHKSVDVSTSFGWTIGSKPGITVSASVGDKHTVYSSFNYTEYNPNSNVYNYTAIFNKQGGSGGSNDVLVTYGSSMPYATAPSRTGSVFAGYYTGINGTGTQYYTSNMESVRTWNISETTTLYACWEPLTFFFRIRVYIKDDNTEKSRIYVNDGNGYYATFHSHVDYKTVTYGSTYSITAPTAPNGYKFSRWIIPGGSYSYILLSTSETIYYTINTDYNSLIALYEEKSCIATGTQITLADGTQKAVENLTGNEMLLVWNLKTGSFDAAPILFIDRDDYREYEIIHLYFSDGTDLKIISEHAFWDFDLNRYVLLRDDAAQYLGHWFNKQITDSSGNLAWTRVQLTDVVLEKEFTIAWSPVTFGHLCIYVNGMLSMPGATEGLINIFEVDGVSMQYDQAAFLADVEEYGLFTYEEFSEILPVPELVFDAFGGQYLKVSIAKGLIDFETLGNLFAKYADFFTEL